MERTSGALPPRTVPLGPLGSQGRCEVMGSVNIGIWWIDEVWVEALEVWVKRVWIHGMSYMRSMETHTSECHKPACTPLFRVRDVLPGEMVIVTQDGKLISRQVSRGQTPDKQRGET